MYSCDDTLAGGLPHSDIHGSKPARGSPWLFAACHVLRRLLVPRHPPNALIALNHPTCTETTHNCRTASSNCKQERPRVLEVIMHNLIYTLRTSDRVPRDPYRMDQ